MPCSHPDTQDRTAPPDPLEQLLRASASRTEDPAVRRWLRRLLERGEVAQGQGATTEGRAEP
jgi:hypothetical protein